MAERRGTMEVLSHCSRSRRRLNISAASDNRAPSDYEKEHFHPIPSHQSKRPRSGRRYEGPSEKRLTRSASKRLKGEMDRPSIQNQSLMGPPQTCQPSSSGMTTRSRYRRYLGFISANDNVTDVTKISSNFNKRLSFDQASNTSDYGTASEHSRKCSSVSGGMSPVSDSGNSCHCASMSGVESLSSCSEDDDCSMNNFGKSQESKSPAMRPVQILHTDGNVYAFIPDINRSQYTGCFSLKNIGKDNEIYRPPQCSSMRVHHVSSVVCMEPHGVHFHEEFPVVLIIPLFVEPQDEEWVSCLYSNTETDCPPLWERLPRKDYKYSNGSLVIRTSHFSLFTVILEEPYLEVMKTIRWQTGGHLKLDEVPGVEVHFPKGSLKQDVDAYLRILYTDEPMLNENHEVGWCRALASPVIMLGPHGYTFTKSVHPVRIKLPIPHYNEIRSRFGHHVGLSVWHSSTVEGEPTCWQTLESPSFLLEPPAKMGMSFFYPYISFSMMCQAFMEESKEASRFGLEVICYRSDKTLPDQSNYRQRVGASVKPKLVKPGRILVRLRSQMFEADIEAGEDPTMEKEEPDFRGRDFEKQYACKFKQDVNIESGTFGKVIVERKAVGKNDPLFEFNLNKSDGGHDVLQPMGSERWTAFAVKELASTLQITEGNNWKKFAQYIGFTKSEIKSKFQYSPDPFLAMMNLYGSRGGTPEEFMQALYAVSRDLRLSSSGIGGSRSDGGSSGHSSNGSKGSGSRDSGSRCSKGSGNKYGMLWGYRPWGQVNNDSDSDSMPADAKESAKKRSRSSLEKKEASGSSSAKRRKFSDVSETVSSGSEGGDEGDSDPEAIKSNNAHINNRRRLNDRDMWKISKGIARKDWRFLGRTLGIEERVLNDLEHQHQSVGFRECAYQMLLEWKGRKPRKCTFGNMYSALLRENMAEIAKHMVKILPEEEEARERDLAD